MNLADIEINPRTDPDGWRAARNAMVCDAKLARIAEMYAGAETDEADVQAWIQAWRRDPHRCPWLLLVGPVGTGKTHSAVAAIRQAVRVPRAVTWEFATCSQLLDDLRPGGPDDAEDRYMRCDLLVIDDIAMVKTNSEWAIETLYRIIDYRRRSNRPVIVTSNLPPRELSTVLNEQIVSRIAQSCTVVALTGADRRRQRAEA